MSVQRAPRPTVDYSILNADPVTEVKAACTAYVRQHGRTKFGIAEKFQIKYTSEVREMPNPSTGVVDGYTVDLLIGYTDTKGAWQRDEMYCTTDYDFGNARAYQPQKPA